MKKSGWKCCSSPKVADTGHYSRGKHNHAPTPSAHDHASGVGFVKDRSTTKAIERNMRNMPWYLKGEIPPPMDMR